MPRPQSKTATSSLDDLQPTLQQFATFQRAYDYFNKELFDNALKPCFLSFNRRAVTGVYFRPAMWQTKGKKEAHEISLNPSVLDKPFAEIMTLLLRGMGWQWQWEQGAPAKSPGYSNRELVMKMESIGLLLSDTGEADGQRTGHYLNHSIIQDGPFEEKLKAMPADIRMPWISVAPPIEPPKSGKKFKYECPKCDASVWGKLGLQMKCDCRQQTGAKWVCEADAEVA